MKRRMICILALCLGLLFPASPPYAQEQGRVRVKVSTSGDWETETLVGFMKALKEYMEVEVVKENPDYTIHALAKHIRGDGTGVSLMAALTWHAPCLGFDEPMPMFVNANVFSGEFNDIDDMARLITLGFMWKSIQPMQKTLDSLATAQQNGLGRP